MNDTFSIQPKGWSLTLAEKARRRAYQCEESAFSIGPKAPEEEEWRHVKGFEGRYRVSSFGRIFKVWFRGGGIMKGAVHSGGYRSVHLTDDNGNAHIKFVHRLVGEAFLPCDGKKLHIHHKDFNRLNNNRDNLMWVSPKENVNFSKLAGRLHGYESDGELNSNAKLTNRDVRIIKKRLGNGDTIRTVARDYQVTDGTIAHIKHNRNWTFI